MSSRGEYDETGRRRRCTEAFPRCMGQAARGVCTCPPREIWCPCGDATVPKPGEKCRDCLSREVDRLTRENERLALAEVGPCNEIRAVQAAEARIVAWLRAASQYGSADGRRARANAAEAIERGDHREEEA